MEKQVVDDILLESLVSTTSLDSLIKGYILNCKTESKSPKTLSSYQMVLKNFSWYCRESKFPQIQKITAVHIRHFLWYLGGETNRWNSKTPSVRSQASATTINGYYRALRTFFNWLEREELIIENPFRHLKTPKPDSKIVQALSPVQVERLFSVCSESLALM